MEWLDPLSDPASDPPCQTKQHTHYCGSPAQTLPPPNWSAPSLPTKCLLHLFYLYCSAHISSFELQSFLFKFFYHTYHSWCLELCVFLFVCLLYAPWAQLRRGAQRPRYYYYSFGLQPFLSGLFLSVHISSFKHPNNICLKASSVNSLSARAECPVSTEFATAQCNHNYTTKQQM